MENLNELKTMLEGFEKEGRFYWIDALVKLGAINKAEAGFLCIALNVNK